MTRVGKKEIELGSGVEVSTDGNGVTVKGPKGELSIELFEGFSISQEDNRVTVINDSKASDSAAKHGLLRALIANMVEGVEKEFIKELDIVGVGYRAQMKGSDLNFSLGFSHPVVVSPLEGIRFEVEGTNKIRIIGVDKQKVGQVAANIRKLRPPDPYKGKGILFAGEVVKKKAGKRV